MKDIIQSYLQKLNVVNSIKEFWWYQIKTPCNIFFKKIHNFIKNCWLFKKELAQFQKYDYAYNLRLFNRSLELTKEQFKKEHVDKQTIFDMERTIELINRMTDDYNFYFDLAEKTINVKTSRCYSNEEILLVYEEIYRLEKLDKAELKELISKITEWWN